MPNAHKRKECTTWQKPPSEPATFEKYLPYIETLLPLTIVGIALFPPHNPLLRLFLGISLFASLAFYGRYRWLRADRASRSAVIWLSVLPFSLLLLSLVLGYRSLLESFIALGFAIGYALYVFRPR